MLRFQQCCCGFQSSFYIERVKRGFKENNINTFTTTLCTSRWKSKKQVDAAGEASQNAVEGIKYWDQDWRKEGLVGRRYELVKEIKFYNQLYCGCQYSLNNTAYKK